METWMEKLEFVATHVSIQGFKEWNDMYTNDEVDENFSSFFSSYLKSCKCSSEDKIWFLDEFSKDIEKELEALEVQIKFQDFQYQSQLFKIFFQKKHEVVMLPLVVKNEELFFILIMNLTTYI
jgi:hypothetical protein